MSPQINSIVDAHVHWWDVEKNPWYDFIRSVDEAEGTDLHRNYLPPDYRRSIADADVSKVVHISAVVVFDLVARLDTLARWTAFVAERPQLNVVLEHSGWPLGTDDVSYQAWEPAVTDFAGATNAAVKISGLVMVTREISIAAMRPWIECCVDRFGWDRILFASNFSVDSVAGSYAELSRVFDAVLEGASGEQLRKLFAGNAERIYRL